MSIIICSRCGTMVDTDYDPDFIVIVEKNPNGNGLVFNDVCSECFTEKEAEDFDKGVTWYE